MTFEKPTYEEYIKATKFARFRYRFGVFIQFIAVLLFLILIFYMIYHGNKVATNPLVYGAEKYNISCSCFKSNMMNPVIFFNSSGLWIEGSQIPEEQINISNISIDK